MIKLFIFCVSIFTDNRNNLYYKMDQRLRAAENQGEEDAISIKSISKV